MASRKRGFSAPPTSATQAEIWAGIGAGSDRSFRPSTVTGALESVLNAGDAPSTFGRLISCTCRLPAGPDHCDLHSPTLLRDLLEERTEQEALTKAKVLEVLEDFGELDITTDDLVDAMKAEGDDLATSILAHDGIRRDCLATIIEKADSTVADELVELLYEVNDRSEATKAIQGRAEREVYGNLFDTIGDILGELTGMPTMGVPPAPEKALKLLLELQAECERRSKP